MCSTGYSRDDFLRLPTYIGAFSETLEGDCSRNDIAFAALAGTTVLISLLLSVVIVYELVQRNQVNSYQWCLFGMLMSLVTIVVMCIVGIYRPNGFISWAVLCFWIWWWTLASLKCYIIDGTLRIISKVTKRSITSLLGGSISVVFMITVVIVCFLATMIGAIGAGTFAFRSRDVETAMIFWSLHCAGFAFFITTVVLYSHYLFGRFADLVESITDDSMVVAAPGPSKPDSTETKSSSVYQKNVHDLIRRFRYGRRGFLLSIPFGAGLWFCHAFVLPVFYYLAFLHLFNNIVPIFFMWYIYTPRTRRCRVIRLLTLGLFFKEDHEKDVIQSPTCSSQHNTTGQIIPKE